ncbi:thiamine biosynthesis protein [Polyangium sp. y55x31]|uniref:thiamine biosynthesis protein n=1 Tax=Polyangium sp. y55x31 TaxID=3042688 RepID=UPI0024822C7E|nr:thiamine biosynthesis protein [Polyangium sp. y55x31]MDI1484470.1 thiamine biosynthesis protein [Polyangium sp. y55x31]
MLDSNARPRRTWTVLFVATLAACSRGSAPSEVSSPAGGSSGPNEAASASGSIASANAPPRRSPRLDDPRWQRAMDEDPAGLGALADTLGAAGLVEALGDGGAITKTALLALPLADDADLALGALGKRALAATDEERGPTLEALLGVAGRPASARDPLDPEGAAEAAAAVLTIAANTALPRDHRALAVSAARALAEKKLVDPTKIPGDLDPP